MTRRAAIVMLGAWVIATCVLTLLPVARINTTPFWAFWHGNMPAADMVRNVMLFAPLGWCLRRLNVRWWMVGLIAAVASGAIEMAQQFIPGRVPSAADIAMNVLGAVVAWRAAAPVRHIEWRVGAVILTFVAIQALWVADLRWPTPVVRIDSSPSGYLRVVGPAEVTYANVYPIKVDAERRWLRIANEQTIGATLGFQPPADAPCPLPWSGVTSYIANPALRCIDTVGEEHWAPRHAGAWIYTVWPRQQYAPNILEAVGAFVFVFAAVMFVRRWPWRLATGYLLGLILVASATGLGQPNAFEAFGALLAPTVLLLVERYGRTLA